jgi:hypothetical protein
MKHTAFLLLALFLIVPNIYSQCRFPEGIYGEWKINKSQSQEILPVIEELVSEVNFILRSIVRSKLFLTNPAYTYIEFEDNDTNFWKVSFDREKWFIVSKKEQTFLWIDENKKTISIEPLPSDSNSQGLEILTNQGVKSLRFSCLRFNRLRLDIEVESKKIPRNLKYFLIYNLDN